MRGMNMAPQLLLAQDCAQRTQHELFSSFCPSRSQWNCTFTRPYLSVQISSPLLPTTKAVCGPRMNGLCVRRGERKTCVVPRAWNSVSKVVFPSAPPPPLPSTAETELLVSTTRYSRLCPL